MRRATESINEERSKLAKAKEEAQQTGAHTVAPGGDLRKSSRQRDLGPAAEGNAAPAQARGERLARGENHHSGSNERRSKEPQALPSTQWKAHEAAAGKEGQARPIRMISQLPNISEEKAMPQQPSGGGYPGGLRQIGEVYRKGGRHIQLGIIGMTETDQQWEQSQSLRDLKHTDDRDR